MQKRRWKLKKSAETQEILKFHFQAPPMLVQKLPGQLSTLFTVTLFPEPKLAFSKNFVQRRWVYSVAEATSLANVKEIGNLQQRVFELEWLPFCLVSLTPKF